MLNAGIHKAYVKDHGLSMAKSGFPQVIVRFEDETGESIIGYFSLRGNALEHTVKKLMNMGFKSKNFESLNDASIGLIGTECVIEVVDQTRADGRVYKEVSWVNRPGYTGEIKEIEKNAEAGEKAKALNGLLAKYAGTVVLTDKGYQPISEQSDEIPF